MIYHLPEINSTNRWMQQALLGNQPPAHGDVVYTDFQTNGYGQPGNHWESETGKNLLCSLLLRPEHLAANAQFSLSEAVALAVTDFLEVRATGFCIKWPNDIYWQDKKIAGILIENRIEQGQVSESVVGIGLNLNQTQFISSAPNPVSLVQITHRPIDTSVAVKRLRMHLMSRFWWAEHHPEILHQAYLGKLYRKDVLAKYRDKQGDFYGYIRDVEAQGRLLVEDESGKNRSYLFKEITFIL